jgi:hypothetical protein
LIKIIMKNPYTIQQEAIYNEAVRLVESGNDCGILAGKLDPEYAMRLRIFTQMLSDEVRKLSLYGRAHAPTYTKKKK